MANFWPSKFLGIGVKSRRFRKVCVDTCIFSIWPVARPVMNERLGMIHSEACQYRRGREVEGQKEHLRAAEQLSHPHPIICRPLREIQRPLPWPRRTHKTGCMTGGGRKKVWARAGRVVGAPFPDPPPPFRAPVTGTPDGPTAEVGGEGKGGSPEAPQHMRLRMIPRDALIISRGVSSGGWFCFPNKVFRAAFAAQVVSHQWSV